MKLALFLALSLAVMSLIAQVNHIGDTLGCGHSQGSLPMLLLPNELPCGRVRVECRHQDCLSPDLPMASPSRPIAASDRLDSIMSRL